jgi:hypothetical protein
VKIVAFGESVAFQEVGLVPFIGVHFSIGDAGSEEKQMSTLIANGGRDLHAPLRNVMHAMTPVTTACSRSLHDGVISSDSISSFIDKARTSLARPEHSNKLFWVCSLKVSAPLGIIE